MLRGGAAVVVTSLLAGRISSDSLPGGQASPARGPRSRPAVNSGFELLAHSAADTIVNPDGYSYRVLVPEGASPTAEAPDYLRGNYNTGAVGK